MKKGTEWLAHNKITNQVGGIAAHAGNEVAVRFNDGARGVEDTAKLVGAAADAACEAGKMVGAEKVCEGSVVSADVAGEVEMRAERVADTLNEAGDALLDFSEKMDCLYPNGWTKRTKTAVSAAGVVYDVWSATRNPNEGVKGSKRFQQLVEDAGPDVALTILEGTPLAEEVDCDYLLGEDYGEYNDDYATEPPVQGQRLCKGSYGTAPAAAVHSAAPASA